MPTKTPLKAQEIETPAPIPPVVKRDWRSRLTADELGTLASARKHVEFWAGAHNLSPLMLIDKLARLLDED